MGFRVQGFGLRVSGFGFRATNLDAGLEVRTEGVYSCGLAFDQRRRRHCAQSVLPSRLGPAGGGPQPVARSRYLLLRRRARRRLRLRSKRRRVKMVRC